MFLLGLILLVATYSLLLIALFLQLLCFFRKIEAIETILFTISLLLLVVSLGAGSVAQNETAAGIPAFVQISMLFVSITTWLNTLKERIHKIKLLYIRIHTALAGVLLILVLISFFTGHLQFTAQAVIVFLIFTVVCAMLIIRLTKPVVRFAHLEKTNRLFSVAFLVLVPLCVGIQLWFVDEYRHLQLDYLLYVSFCALALGKIYDDLKRLSLIRLNTPTDIQRIRNFGLTEREEEIAVLLSKGHSYQKISAQLFIAMPTVKTHVGHIYKKCGVKSRHELTLLLIG
jgi:DNA-binding CsgD family transcriptional regulator